MLDEVSFSNIMPRHSIFNYPTVGIMLEVGALKAGLHTIEKKFRNSQFAIFLKIRKRNPQLRATLIGRGAFN